MKSKKENSESCPIVYLVDTSIWVEFFRGRQPAIKNRVFSLLDQKRVIINGVIILELLMGARSNKEINFIKEKLANLNSLSEDINFFIYAGDLGKEIRKTGMNLPLSDIFIAAHARLHNLMIFTMDKHFESIGKEFGIQYEIIQNF
jgi:predicted nucleic acid-binding protein